LRLPLEEALSLDCLIAFSPPETDKHLMRFSLDTSATFEKSRTEHKGAA
jgi:hypothetical protein